MKKNTATSETIFILRISLKDSEPLIWRRVAIPGTMTLNDLHNVIQIVMIWEECHLWFFKKDAMYYIDPDVTEDDDSLFTAWKNVDEVLLKDVFTEINSLLLYTYDLGDGWEHEIVLEKITAPSSKKNYPCCMAGKMASPPEDAGGLHGYYDKLKILQKPRHPEYKEIAEWMGKDFDPDEFDLEIINDEMMDFFEEKEERERLLVSLPQTKEQWLKEILSAYREAVRMLPQESQEKIYLLAPAIGIKKRNALVDEEEVLADLKRFFDQFYREWHPWQNTPPYEMNPVMSFCLWYLFFHVSFDLLDMDYLDEIMQICSENLELFSIITIN